MGPPSLETFLSQKRALCPYAQTDTLTWHKADIIRGIYRDKALC